MKNSQKTKELIFGLIILSVTVLLILLVLEGYFRIFDPQNLEVSRYNPYYDWEHRPGFNTRFTSLLADEFDISITINEKGLRDRDYDYERNNKKRVLILGDSYTFGHGVEAENTFSSLLEEQTGYEIINAGHKGMNLDKETQFYRKEGYKYDPDIVIVTVFIGNDISINQRLTVAEDFTLTDANPAPTLGVSRQIRLFLAQHTHVYNFLTESLLKITSTREFLRDIGIFKPPHIPYYFVEVNDFQNRIDGTLELIQALDQLVENEGKEFVLVILPDRAQVYDLAVSMNTQIFGLEPTFDPLWPTEEILSMCFEKNITCLDALPALQNGELFFFPADSHLNAAGHEEVANFLYQELFAEPDGKQ